MKEIYSALIKAQAQFPTIEKSKTVDTGTFNFKYASYADICLAIKKPLADNNLAFIHPRTYVDAESGERLWTILIHESGEQIQTSQPVPIFTDAKQYGAWLTYMRRYQLSALLGLASDDDVEAPAISEIDIEGKISEMAIEEFTRVQITQTLVESDFCEWLCGVKKVTDIPASQEKRLLSALKTIEEKNKRTVKDEAKHLPEPAVRGTIGTGSMKKKGG